MSKLDLLKFLESYEGETEIADFTPDELSELIERMQREGRGRSAHERGVQKEIF